MTISIIAKNATQAEQSIIRGGRLTEIGDGTFLEANLIQGGLGDYEVPNQKVAIIIGSLVITSLGTDNTFIEVEFRDNQSGRTIPVVRGTALGQTILFKIKLAQRRQRPPFGIDMAMGVTGDGAVDDGTAEWWAEIQELPL